MIVCLDIDEISFTSAACGSKAPRVSGAEVTDIDIARHSERGMYYRVCSIFLSGARRTQPPGDE